MPHHMTMMQLNDQRERLAELNIDKVAKPDLGTLGIPVLAQIVPKLRKELDVIASTIDECSEEQLREVIAAYGDYISLLYEIEGLKGQSFASRREELGEKLRMSWEPTRKVWPIFAALAIDQSGLLHDPTSLQQKISIAAQEGEAAIRSVIDEFLERAKAEADRITSNAHKTAEKLSIKDAQDKFKEASASLTTKACVSGGIALCSFFAFLWFAKSFYDHIPPTSGEPSQLYQAIYLTALRITILTAIGALTTFFLKMLRAYLHMSEFNNHRRRVANSMSAFVESAQSPEQRDLILGRLVDSIVTFGDSGILNKDVEGISVPSVVIDAVTKNLAPKA